MINIMNDTIYDILMQVIDRISNHGMIIAI